MKQRVYLIVSALLFSSNIRAQQLNISKDFALVQGGSDTIPALVFHEDPSEYHEQLLVYQLSSFYISRTCVSVNEYAAFCKKLQKKMPPPPAWGWGDLKKPMVNVSYLDALEYCHFLTDLWGVPVRLAAEAEWVYASFGGRFVNHLAGGYVVLADIDKYAAYQKNGNAADRPVCVTCKQPNTLGIYDMWGNVWEWVDGWFHMPGDTAVAGNRKMIIGGSFRSPREDMHSENKLMQQQEYRADDLGFRVVIAKQDWDRKLFLDKINGQIKKAYGENAPVYFAADGISAGDKTISWSDFTDMKVDNALKKVTVTGKNASVEWHYNTAQYNRIKQMQADFMKDVEVMLSNQ
mgnify:FL=1|jgi:Uncharacterized conserved protein